MELNKLEIINDQVVSLFQSKGNIQISQQKMMQPSTSNFVTIDGRSIQPGPLSRIQDIQQPSQMSGPTETMNMSWGPMMNQSSRLSRGSETEKSQHEDAGESEKKSKPEPSEKKT